MMADDNSGKGSPGLFTGGLGGMGGMSRNSLGGAAQLSPYLNFDPSYLQTAEPDYLYDTEAKRGRLEKSFTAIGSSVCLGAGVGGAYGLFDGIRQTAMSDMSGRLRRTQVTNYTLKSAASVSNALGSVVVSYSICHALLSLADDNERLPEEAKSCISGALTGLLFKSTSGAVKCLKGGAVGLGLASLWAFGLKKQETVQHYI